MNKTFELTEEQQQIAIYALEMYIKEMRNILVHWKTNDRIKALHNYNEVLVKLGGKPIKWFDEEEEEE